MAKPYPAPLVNGSEKSYLPNSLPNACVFCASRPYSQSTRKPASRPLLPSAFRSKNSQFCWGLNPFGFVLKTPSEFVVVLIWTQPPMSHWESSPNSSFPRSQPSPLLLRNEITGAS